MGGGAVWYGSEPNARWLGRKKRDPSRGSPRSFAAQKTLAQDDKSNRTTTQESGAIIADRAEAFMAKRILLAGVLGGIAMFLWSSVAHLVLPLAETGVQEIPNEPAVLGPMNSQLGASSGLYVFPGMGLGPEATRQQKSAAMQQYEQKLASNPSGLLIYHPPGAKALTPGQLGTEFLTEFLEALLVAFLLAQTRIPSFASRVGFVTLAGVMAAITTNIPYWNWYGFPANYTAAYMTMEIVGYLVAGLVIAAVVKTQARL
jgi:hypothetical protein